MIFSQLTFEFVAPCIFSYSSHLFLFRVSLPFRIFFIYFSSLSLFPKLIKFQLKFTCSTKLARNADKSWTESNPGALFASTHQPSLQACTLLWTPHVGPLCGYPRPWQKRMQGMQCLPCQVASNRFFGELGSNGGGNCKGDEPASLASIAAANLRTQWLILRVYNFHLIPFST